MTEETDSVLTEEQRCRAEALEMARAVLAPRTIGGTGKVDVTEVHSLAEFILTGEDPWGKPVVQRVVNAAGNTVAEFSRPNSFVDARPQFVGDRPLCAGTCPPETPCNGVRCSGYTSRVSVCPGGPGCRAACCETGGVQTGCCETTQASTPPDVAVNAVLDALNIEIERICEKRDRVTISIWDVNRAIREARPVVPATPSSD